MSYVNFCTSSRKVYKAAVFPGFQDMYCFDFTFNGKPLWELPRKYKEFTVA